MTCKAQMVRRTIVERAKVWFDHGVYLRGTSDLGKRKIDSLAVPCILQAIAATTSEPNVIDSANLVRHPNDDVEAGVDAKEASQSSTSSQKPLAATPAGA